jgi:hypothetical protein
MHQAAKRKHVLEDQHPSHPRWIYLPRLAPERLLGRKRHPTQHVHPLAQAR